MENTKTIPAPAWVNPGARVTTGLDLLGLRNPAQRIGDALLSGITTIAPTARYFGLLCWVIRRYWLAELPNSYREFLSFVRRHEAAIVLGNILAHPDSVGLVGVTSGQRVLESAVDEVELHLDVQSPAWNAYAGPAEQLGLIQYARDSDVPHLTRSRGAELARLVERGLVETQLGQRIVEDPGLASAHLEVLAEFGEAAAIAHLPDDERDCFLRCVLPESPIDPMEEHRRQTWAAVLALTQQGEQMFEGRFLFDTATMPDRPTPECLDPILDSWALYVVRYTLAVVHEAALEELLEQVAQLGGGPVPGSRVIDTLLADDGQVSEPFRELDLLGEHESIAKLRFSDLMERLRRRLVTPQTTVRDGLRFWDDPLNELHLQDLADGPAPRATSLLPIAWILAVLRVEQGMGERLPEFEAVSREGRFRVGLRQVVRPTLAQFRERDATVLEAIAELARRTVDQHLQTAWSRLRFSPRKDVSLVSTDGEFWSKRQGFRGGRLATRMGQVAGWLKQLGLADKAGLTQVGLEVLRQQLQLLEQPRQS